MKMRTNDTYKVKISHIHSMADLQKEKERLQTEIVRSEEGIKSNYQNLVQLLSFRNIIGNLVEEISTTTTVIGKLFSFGKDFLAKRKKKKKAKHEQQEQQEQQDVNKEEQAG